MIKDRPFDVLRVFFDNIFSNCTDGCSVIPFLEKDEGDRFFTVTKRGVWLLTIAENILAFILCVFNVVILAILLFRTRFKVSKGDDICLCAAVFVCILLVYFRNIFGRETVSIIPGMVLSF